MTDNGVGIYNRYMLPKTILVTNKTNIKYLSGFCGSHAYLLMNGKRGSLFTDGRYLMETRKNIKKDFNVLAVKNDSFGELKKIIKRSRIKNLGFEGGSISYKFWKKLKGNFPRLVDVGTFFDEKRMRKTESELDAISKAQNITDKIFENLRHWLKIGRSEKEIAWKIVSLAHDFGAEEVSFPPIVGIGQNSAAPHHKNSDRRLKAGDMILIDMGVIYKNYCSDMTRVLFTKKPNQEQETIYSLVLKAQLNAIKNIKAGVTGKKADSFARKMLEERGFGKNFTHSLGHGVGMEIHELPNLSPKYDGKIPENSVVTVEPGVYLPGKFGVRLEDMVIVKENGALNMTKTPKDLKSAIIRL